MITRTLFFLTLFACASKSPDRFHAMSAWKGQDAKKLQTHPYFGTLAPIKRSHEGEIETWIFRDQSKFQTGAYCQSLGGCIGMPVINCDHAFSVRNGLILGYDQAGTCPDHAVIEVSRKPKE